MRPPGRGLTVAAMVTGLAGLVLAAVAVFLLNGTDPSPARLAVGPAAGKAAAMLLVLAVALGAAARVVRREESDAADPSLD